jgi:serine/threonine protein phosphatase PrpC
MLNNNCATLRFIFRYVLLGIIIFINLYPDKISVGLCLDKGPRDYMEDRYRIINRPETDEYFFGVFDGHGGYKVAGFLANILHPFYLDNLYNKCNIPEALKNSFEAIHEALDPQISTNQGSTAVVVVVKDQKIYTANVGDSRAVLCRNGQAVDLSYDHKPTRQNEIRRIQMIRGGKICVPVKVLDKSITKWVITIKKSKFLNIQYRSMLVNKFYEIGAPRVFNSECYSSVMTRVIGDKAMSDVLIPTPEITVEDILPEDEFIIMASDGIWDVLTSQFAVDIVKEALDKGKSPDDAAKRLMRIARVNGSEDNITVLIIK